LLCERLLSKSSWDNGKEVFFIQKLQKECGQTYINRLDNMFKDIKQAEEVMKEYKDLEKGGKSKKQSHADVDTEF